MASALSDDNFPYLADNESESETSTRKYRKKDNSRKIVSHVSLSTDEEVPTETENPQQLEIEKTKTCLGCPGGAAIFLKYVIPTVFGMGLYCMDIYTDIHAAIFDYRKGDYEFAYATISLVFTPGIVFAFYMFSEVRFHNKGLLRCMKAPFWFALIPIFPFWPILRSIQNIAHGTLASCGINQSYHIGKLTAPSRAYLLNFLQSFTESAPQLLLRLYRIAIRSDQYFHEIEMVELGQIVFSLLSLAFSLPSTYQKYVTTSGIIAGENMNISCITKMFATFWWLFFLISRFEAMSLFAAVYGWWLLLVVGLHMALLVLLQTVSTTTNRFKRFLIYIFQSFVFVFAYIQFNVKTRIKMPLWIPYILFSISMFIENTIMMITWFLRFNILNIPQNVTNQNISLNSSSEISHEHHHHSLHQRSNQEHSHHHHMQTNNLEADSSSYIKYYDEILLFVHFLTYAVGLIFMLLAFSWEAHHDQKPKIKPEDDINLPVPIPKSEIQKLNSNQDDNAV